jgi:hypothetical protein
VPAATTTDPLDRTTTLTYGRFLWGMKKGTGYFSMSLRGRPRGRNVVSNPYRELLLPRRRAIGRLPLHTFPYPLQFILEQGLLHPLVAVLAS